MKRLIVIYYFLPAAILYPQIDTSHTANQIINSIIDESEFREEDSQLIDLIEDLMHNPININEAEIDELIRIPTIDLNIANSIIKFRNRHGRYSSFEQLNSVENMTIEMLEEIIPFIKIESGKPAGIEANRLFHLNHIYYRSRLSFDLQNRRGIIEDKFMGDKIKIYNRLKGENDFIKFSMLTEKDAGETSAADFYSFNISADEIYFLDKIIIGDYIIEFGQGLSLWGPYSFGKGTNTVAGISKSARDIIPYSGADENQYFRGITSGIHFKNTELLFFYSSKRIDANVDVNDFITSLPIDGYHRTENELRRKDGSKVRSIGVILNYSPIKRTSINFLIYNSKFSNSLIRKAIYDPQGNSFNFYSLSYSSIFDKFFLSGEIAYNGKSVAAINNLEATVNEHLSVSLSIRNYPRNYFNLYGNGFGESANTKNEFGIYAGFQARYSSTRINLYYDQFKSPFASTFDPLPVLGNEFLFNAVHSFTSISKLKFRFTRETKESKSRTDNRDIYLKRTRQKIRLEYIFGVSKYIRLKSRIEFSNISGNEFIYDESGFLCLQDIYFSPFQDLDIYARLIFFDTDSYESRIYEFENDHFGVLKNLPLYETGSRWYILLKYHLLKQLKISIKYSEQLLPDQRTIGSGLNEIYGNFSNNFSVQIDCTF